MSATLQDVEDITDLKLILLDKKAGDSVTMKILRKHMLFADEELDLNVELSSPINFGRMPPSHPR